MKDAQLKMLPIERASLPMPFNTSPTPFMTPCAVPQALSVRVHASAKKIRFIITAPFFDSGLENFAQFAKHFWGTYKKTLPVCSMERPVWTFYSCSSVPYITLLILNLHDLRINDIASIY